jgi:hypothetical protein
MKTIKLILSITLLSFLTSNAQITKGNWMVGGDASYSKKESYANNFNSSKRKTSELDIKANVGYFFIDNFQAGIRLSYLNYNLKNDDSGSSNKHWLKYGIYSRYYFLKTEKLVNIYLDGGYFFGNRIYYNGDFKDNLNGYSLSAGPTIFLNSSVAMEMGINYSSTKLKGVNDFTENDLQFTIGFQIFLEKQ